MKGAAVKGDATLTGTVPSYGKVWAEDLVWTLQGVNMVGCPRLNPRLQRMVSVLVAIM